MTLQEFDTVDVLRLEVEAEPDGLVNLVQNPNGELGGWGWLSPIAGSAVLSGGPGGAYLVYTSPGGVASYWTTEPLPVVAAEYVAARWTYNGTESTGYYRARFEWLNSAGAVLSSTAQSGYLNANGDVQYGPSQAPASTAYVRLRFDHYANTSGGNPAAGADMVLNRVTVAASAVVGDLGSIRTNLETNPSFELLPVGTLQTYFEGPGGVSGGRNGAAAPADSYAGNYRWEVTVTGPAVTAAGVKWLTPIPVTPGKRYGIRCHVKAAAGNPADEVWIDHQWLDAGGAVVGTSTALAGTLTAAYAAFTAYADAPAGATQLLRIVKVKPGSGSVLTVGINPKFDAIITEQTDAIASYFSGDTADAGGVDYSWTGAANASTSRATTTSLAYIPPVPFLNVLGSVNSIRIGREALNLGTLEAVIPDSALDPAQVETIRPGRAVRLVTAADREPIFTGEILNGKAVYDPANPDPTKRVRVTMTAVDNTSSLAQQPRPAGVETIAELPYVLEGAGVPWNVNGSGDQVPTATVVALNSNASAIDQVAITRDNHLGQAWVDRRNVLQAWDTPDPTVQAVLDETTYSGIAIDYDTERCINIVTVIFLRSTGEDTEEITYGPYVDSESVRVWGEHGAEFRIQWADEDETAIEAYADAILTANGTPVIRVNSVTLPIRTVADLSAVAGDKRAVLDLMDLVTVSNGNAGIEGDHRVTSLTHTITGGLWTVEVGFVIDGSVASPQVTPSPPAATSWWPETRMLFGAKSTCPSSFLVMDGSAFDVGKYPALAAHLIALGLPSGVLPDMTDVFPIGAGTKALGTSGGNATKSWNTPAGGTHTHSIPGQPDETAGTAAAGTGVNIVRRATFNGHAHGGDTGSGTTHSHPINNADVMNPWRAVYFIIRAG